jgi:hypothetical protein
MDVSQNKTTKMDINEYKNSLAGEIEYARQYSEQNKDKYNGIVTI